MIRKFYSMYIDGFGGNPARCMDCGLDYSEFKLDIVLPHSQWVAINPANDGLLCAQCIVNRLSKIPGVVCVHAIAEVNLGVQASVATMLNSKEEDDSIKSTKREDEKENHGE